MTSWKRSPVLSNLPLPLISLTHPGMWQVERFKVLQMKYIQSFFSITGREEGGGGGFQGTGFLPVQRTAERSGGTPYGRNQEEASPIPLLYPAWPPCTYCTVRNFGGLPCHFASSFSSYFILFFYSIVFFCLFLYFSSHPLISLNLSMILLLRHEE